MNDRVLELERQVKDLRARYADQGHKLFKLKSWYDTLSTSFMKHMDSLHDRQAKLEGDLHASRAREIILESLLDQLMQVLNREAEADAEFRSQFYKTLAHWRTTTSDTLAQYEEIRATQLRIERDLFPTTNYMEQLDKSRRELDHGGEEMGDPNPPPPLPPRKL